MASRKRAGQQRHLFPHQRTPKALPCAIEVQLKHGSAGDLMGLQGKPIAGGQPRFFEVKGHAVAGDVAGIKKMLDAENPPGQWNRVEILAQGPRYQVWLNGKLVHGHNIDRGMVPDQDLAPIELKKGITQLRLKITQGGGGWTACARIVGTDGLPIAGLRVEPPGAP